MCSSMVTSLHKGLGLVPSTENKENELVQASKLGVVVHAVISGLRRLRQKDGNVEDIFNYRGDHNSNNKKFKQTSK